MDHQILNLQIPNFQLFKNKQTFFMVKWALMIQKKIIISALLFNFFEIKSPKIYKICSFRIGCWHEMNKIKDWYTRLHLLSMLSREILKGYTHALIQAMTDAAIFTISRSRIIGYGKIRPLADYRSRLLNLKNIYSPPD